MFADDFKIYYKVDSINDCQFLLFEIGSIENWYESFRLHLNVAKCKLVSYSHKNERIFLIMH